MLDYWGVNNSLRCRHIREKIVKEDGKSLTKSSDEKKTMAGYRKGNVLEHKAAPCHPLEITEFSSGRANFVLCAVMKCQESDDVTPSSHLVSHISGTLGHFSDIS